MFFVLQFLFGQIRHWHPTRDSKNNLILSSSKFILGHYRHYIFIFRVIKYYTLAGGILKWPNRVQLSAGFGQLIGAYFKPYLRLSFIGKWMGRREYIPYYDMVLLWKLPFFNKIGHNSENNHPIHECYTFPNLDFQELPYDIKSWQQYFWPDFRKFSKGLHHDFGQKSKKIFLVHIPQTFNADLRGFKPCFINGISFPCRLNTSWEMVKNVFQKLKNVVHIIFGKKPADPIILF